MTLSIRQVLTILWQNRMIKGPSSIKFFVRLTSNSFCQESNLPTTINMLLNYLMYGQTSIEVKMETLKSYNFIM